MFILTPEQLEQVKAIIQKHHAALLFQIIGPEAMSDDELEALGSSAAGKQLLDAIKQSYLYGLAQASGELGPDSSFAEFMVWLKKNPVPLSNAETLAVRAAQQHAGAHIRHLGAKVVQQFDQLVFEEDAKARAKMLREVQNQTAQNIQKRESISALKFELGRRLENWERDWNRVAITEKVNAMNQGVADDYRQKHGDPWVYKQPMPDACFIAGTMVETRSGPKAIETIEVGDEVLTHKLRWRRVTALHRNPYSGLIYGLDQKPNMTAAHPVLVDLDWRRADAIQEGDQVVRLQTMNTDHEPSPSAQSGLLSAVPGTGGPTTVPVASVQLYRHLQMRNSDVDVPYVDGHFRNGREVLESLDQGEAIWSRSRERSLSGKGLLSLRFWSHRLRSGLSRVFGQVSKFFGTHSLDLRPLALGGGGPVDTQFVQTTFDNPSGHSEVLRDAGHGVASGLQHLDHEGFVDVGFWLNHAPYVSTIHEVVKERFKGEVFNLSVEDDESYFADGVAVHNCKHCLRLHIGPDGHPRLFRLSTLENAGTNVGVKAANWKAVVGTTHPHCHPEGTGILTPEGEVSIEHMAPGMNVVSHDGSVQKVTSVWSQVVETEMVTIWTKDGAVQATPEHQLLTSSGWVAASSLNQNAQDLVRVDLDVEDPMELVAQHEPSSGLEEGRLARVLLLLSGTGMPVTAVDFDGHLFVWKRQVDVEDVDGVVRVRLKPAPDQSIVQRGLVGPVHLSGSTLRVGDEDFVSFAHTPAGLVSGGHVRFEPLGVSSFLSGGDAARFKASLSDAESYGPTADTEGLCYLLHRTQLIEVHPKDGGRVEVDSVLSHERIVSVSSRKFKGRVWNLTVQNNESYVANGVASHNCQCQLVRVPDGWGFDEDGDLTPTGKGGIKYESEADAEKAMVAEDQLQKSWRIKDRITFQGLPIAIEQRVGDERKWADKTTGEEGSTLMRFAYGYIEGTLGPDGDEYDCYVGPDPSAPFVYVVHQNEAGGSREWDEDKVMLGFSSPHAAKDAYLIHYDRAEFYGSMSQMTVEEFRTKVLQTRHAGSLYADGMVKAEVAPSAAMFSPAGNRGVYQGTTGAQLYIGIPQPFDHLQSSKPRIQMTPNELADVETRRKQRGDRRYVVGTPAETYHRLPGVEITENVYDWGFDQSTANLNLDAIAESPRNRRKLEDEINRRLDKTGPNYADPTKKYPKHSFVLDDEDKSGIQKRVAKLKEQAVQKSKHKIKRVHREKSLQKAGGPYIGPRGGLWADPQLTIPWDKRKRAIPKKKKAAEKERPLPNKVEWRSGLPDWCPKPTFGREAWEPENFGKRGGTEQMHFDQSTGAFTPERKALHDAIVESFFVDEDGKPRGVQKPGEPPTVTVTMGGPGSGKTSILKLFEQGTGAVTVNSDDVKTQLPEFHQLVEEGYREAAAAVQHESHVVMERVLSRTIEEKRDFVYDRTGVDRDDFVAELLAFKEAGYRIDLIMPHLPASLAAVRATTRGKRSGRFVPEPLLYSIHERVPKNFAAAAAVADSALLVDNSTHQGGDPQVLFLMKDGQIHIAEENIPPSFEGLEELASSVLRAETTEKAMHRMDKLIELNKLAQRLERRPAPDRFKPGEGVIVRVISDGKHRYIVDEGDET